MHKSLLYTALFFFVFAHTAFAQVVISEIMYDLDGADSKHEWVEIYNTGSEATDLSGWKLFENSANHKLSLIQGSEQLTGGGSAVIADNAAVFLEDWPGFSGTLFDSSFSLSNSGETLTLRDSEGIDKDSVSYVSDWGAQGDGNSLQLVDGSFTPLAPTPGEHTASQSPPPSPSEDTVHNESTPPAQTASIIPPSLVLPEIFVDAQGDTHAVVGADTFFQGRAFGDAGAPLINARYLWNFGDGSTKEGQQVLHAFAYPGEYIVVLDASSGLVSSSDRLVVSVRSADITISSIEKGENGFITLHNTGAHELNLSSWVLSADTQHFVLPKHTFILPNTHISFSALVTGLVVTDPTTVALLYPNGTHARSFSPPLTVPPQQPLAEAVPVQSFQTQESPQPIAGVSDGVLSSASVPVLPEGGDEQMAAPGAAVAALSASNEGTHMLMWVFVLVGVIVAGVFGVLLMGGGTASTQQLQVQKIAREITIVE